MNLEEEQLHELARLVMVSISPITTLSLDEFVLQVTMTPEQAELCYTVLTYFDEL